MRHDNDNMPMTVEKATKLKAHELIMRMVNVGIPWKYANVAAIVTVLELKQQFFKKFKGTEDERKKANDHFERLEHGVKGYLPMPKDFKNPE